MVKVYCEHSALSSDLRAMQREGLIELVHFPYDRDSSSRHLKTLAVPSAALWTDLNLTWAEDKYAWSDHSGSRHLREIREVLGPLNRRDALHIDSAYKTGCRAFVTRDREILNQRKRLEDLLGIRFFHPDENTEDLRRFVQSENYPP